MFRYILFTLLSIQLFFASHCMNIPSDNCSSECTTERTIGGSQTSLIGTLGPTTGLSKVDNWTLNFHHSSSEYKIAKKPEACTSCGGSSISPETPALSLTRYFRSRNTAEAICSLGPANFTNYDLNLIAFSAGESILIQIFDPALNSKNMFYQHEDGYFYDDIEQQRKNIILYDSNDQSTTSLESLAYGILTTRSGDQYRFDFFLDDNKYCGRFVSYKDRRGDGYDISYVYGVDAAVDSSLKKQFLQVTDSNGRQLSFSYLTNNQNQEKTNTIYYGSIKIPNSLTNKKLKIKIKISRDLLNSFLNVPKTNWQLNIVKSRYL